jgi:hypothetical protein
MERDGMTRGSRLWRRVLPAFLLGFALSGLGGAGCAPGINSGCVESPTLSDDGETLAFSDGENVYVADSKGVRHVAQANRYALSRSGRFVLSIKATAWIIQAGDVATLCDVGSGKQFSMTLPEAPDAWKAKHPSGAHDWPETFGFEVFVEDAPAVVFGLPAAEGKGTTDGALNSRMIYLRWQPGGDWTSVARPPASLAARMHKHNVSLGGREDLPIVEFGCDGINARRTVWVRPDGSTLEVLRQNDVPVRTAEYVAALPIFFWNPMYWAGAFQPARGLEAQDQTKPNARLAELVARRKAAAAP